jgi:hypothetical protein
MTVNPDLSSLADKWPSSFVSRDKVGEFSGGILHPRTLANLDALGQGPKGRIRVNGKKCAYPVNELISWLESRSDLVEDKESKS